MSIAGSHEKSCARSLLILKIAEFDQFGENSRYAFLDGLSMRLNHQIGVLWLLVGIIYACKMLDLALVHQFVQPLDIALAANFQRALDIDFHEIANLLTRPGPRLAIGSNGGRDAEHAVTRQQLRDIGDTLNIGIAVFATEA